MAREQSRKPPGADTVLRQIRRECPANQGVGEYPFLKIEKASPLTRSETNGKRRIAL